MPELSSEQKEEFSNSISRAKATMEFVESSFFKNWFKPHLEKGINQLEKSISKIAIDSILRGDPSDRMVVLLGANVGKMEGISSIIKDLLAWVEEGAYAAKRLNKEEVSR